MSYYVYSPARFKQFLQTIKITKPPQTASEKWLLTLGFKSKADRNFLNILKQISFLDKSNKPTSNYYGFLEFETSAITMAKSILEGYSFLYTIYPKAHEKDSESLIHAFMMYLNININTSKLAEKTFRVLTNFADFNLLDEYGNEQKSSKSPKIFINYSEHNKEIAHNIANLLNNNEYYVKYLYENSSVDDQFLYEIRKVITPNDFLFILISNDYINNEFITSNLFKNYLKELVDRNIMIITLSIDNLEIPDYFKEYSLLSKKYNQNEFMNLLYDIQNMQKINFSILNGKEFEDLIVDLLMNLNFVNIQKQYKENNIEIDILAEYYKMDPFGFEEKEVYIIETKLYKYDRASINALNQFIFNLINLPINYKSILITTGQLTSSAKKWLIQTINQKRINIKIIEGQELKNILIKHPDLINKYFSNKGEKL